MSPATSSLIRGLLLQTRWFLLAMASGMVNTGAFLACARFVSHVTGFATLFGIEMGRFRWSDAFSVLAVPLYFLLGGMFSAWMTDRRIQAGLNPFYTLPLVVISVLLASASFFGRQGLFGEFGAPFDLAQHYLLLVLLCLASGIQNAVVTTGTGTILRASHLTGTTTDLSTGLMRALLLPKGSIDRQLEMRLNWMRACTIYSFVGGAVAGGFAFEYWGYMAFLFPSGICLAVGIWIALHHK